MPAAFTLYIDTSQDQLVAGQQQTTVVSGASLPLFYGDTISLIIYLLARNPNVLPNSPQPYVIIPTNGLTLFFYIDDGTISGTIYTQQLTWTSSSDNTYFSANLSLVTAPLLALIGSGSASKNAFLKVGYVQNGLQTTVLSTTVSIGVGLPTGNVPAVPAGQTALSLEVATALFFPKQPVNGQPLVFASGTGRQIELFAEDTPDGACKLDASPL